MRAGVPFWHTGPRDEPQVAGLRGSCTSPSAFFSLYKILHFSHLKSPSQCNFAAWSFSLEFAEVGKLQPTGQIQPRYVRETPTSAPAFHSKATCLFWGGLVVHIDENIYSLFLHQERKGNYWSLTQRNSLQLPGTLKCRVSVWVCCSF